MRNAELIATLFFSDKSTINVFYLFDDSGMASGDAQDFFMDILEQAVRSSDVFSILRPPYYAQIEGHFSDCLKLDGLRGVCRSKERFGHAR